MSFNSEGVYRSEAKRWNYKQNVQTITTKIYTMKLLQSAFGTMFDTCYRKHFKRRDHQKVRRVSEMLHFRQLFLLKHGFWLLYLSSRVCPYHFWCLCVCQMLMRSLSSDKGFLLHKAYSRTQIINCTWRN